MYTLHPDEPANDTQTCGYELITSHPAPFGRTDTCSNQPTVDDYGIYGANDEARTVIADAIDRFAAAGLPLPQLRIYVHHTDQGCFGHQGLFTKGGDLHRIDLCDLDATIHELAHAWEHHHLTDTTRQAFMNTFNIDTWNDNDTAHAHRGVEQVAFASPGDWPMSPCRPCWPTTTPTNWPATNCSPAATPPGLQTPNHTHTTPDIDPDTINTTTDPTFG